MTKQTKSTVQSVAQRREKALRKIVLVENVRGFFRSEVLKPHKATSKLNFVESGAY
jgi:hypothetical protein